MPLTPEQVKGRIKSLSKKNNADARTLMRVYMMERFLERIANSKYKDNFIIKGGMLVTSMVGISLRSTMDIDASIENQNLSANDAWKIISEIKNIDLGDSVTFEIVDVSEIMDQMEYPGIRVSLKAIMGKMINPIKIDISTGDAITPQSIEYNYRLLLEDKAISLRSYNLETVLAEKLQTILVRGISNTRMRDYYDIDILLSLYGENVDERTLKEAFNATCKKRGTENLAVNCSNIMKNISSDEKLFKLWESYKNKYAYAANIRYQDVIKSAELLLDKIK